MKNPQWEVEFDLAYDLGGAPPWTKQYRTKIGARISMFWNKNIASWGGTAKLTKIKKGN